jgi:arsenate reductase
MEIYHNPRCSKSRNTLNIIKEKGKEVNIIEYLKTPPTKNELIAIIKKLGIPARDLVRKSEQDYKDHFKGKDLSDEEWIEAMVKYPKLIERPIVINGDKAVIGRPPEKVLEILD